MKQAELRYPISLDKTADPQFFGYAKSCMEQAKWCFSKLQELKEDTDQIAND